MSWIAAAIVGGSAIMAGGNYLSARQAAKGGYGNVSTLNAPQRQVQASLAPKLISGLNDEPALYTGQYTTPITPEEQAVIDRQSRLSAMVGDWSKYYQPGYIDPEVDATEWANLNQKFYGNNIYPGAKALAEEQYAGPSGVGFWSTPRANAVLNEYNTSVIDPYRSIRSNLLQNSYQNAINYGINASNINQLTEGLVGIPRSIKQYGLEQQYNEWIRGQNMSKTYVDQALNFLGVETQAREYTPAGPSLAGMMLSGIGSGIAGVGMFGGFGSGGNSGGYNATAGQYGPVGTGTAQGSANAYRLNQLRY